MCNLCDRYTIGVIRDKKVLGLNFVKQETDLMKRDGLSKDE